MGKMRARIIVCVGVALARPAVADKGPGEARAKYTQAAQLAADDDNDKALVLVNEGLALAPRDLRLLELNGTLLLKLRDYEGALVAYQAYLQAGASGANRRAAQRIVTSLQSVRSSFLELAVTNGPAFVYLDSRTHGAFCTAAPTCSKGVLPGEYKVIVERPGFAKWTQHITVELGKTKSIAVTLDEKPSTITVRAPDGARIALDGAPYTGLAVPAGEHQLEVALAGFGTVRKAVTVHEGKPAEVRVELAPLVPITVAPGVEISIDDHVVAIEGGGVPVAPGPHVLVARARGFHDSRIDIPEHRAPDYAIDVGLKPVGALVRVEGVPHGTRIVVDGKTLATTPVAEPVEVAPGAHTVEVRAPGYRPYRGRGTFAADRQATLRLTRLRPESHRFTYVAAASTTGALALGAVFSLLAMHRQDAYATRAGRPGVTADDPTLSSMKSRGEDFALAADLGFGLAIAGAAVTTYLFVREGRGESSGALSFGVGPTGAGVAGRF
jgi:hypothetical protein